MWGTLVRPAPAGSLRLTIAQRTAVRRAAAAASGLVVLGAVVALAAYVWVAVHRLGYPYELDWLEGGALEQVRRVLDGGSLYTAPSLAYVSYTYPPLYSYVAAAVATVTGVGFLPLRLVSFASSLVAIGLTGRWVADVTADRTAACASAGLFAATYALTGWWFDVGRLDSLFVALTLAALWLGRRADGTRAGAAAGLVAFLAFFTKQIAPVAIVPALIWLALVRPRVGLAALATLGVLIAASTLLLDGLTGGWYRYYILSELAGQPWVRREWFGFWRIDLYQQLRPLTLLGVLALVGVLWRRHRPAIGYELAATLGLLLAAWFSRLHSGGYVNVLMPAYAACAVLGGLAFAWLRRRGPLPALIAVALVLVQLAQLLTLPDHALPHRSAHNAGAELIASLRSLPGPVLVLAHPWYGTLAGKGSFAQEDAITEVLRSRAAHGSDDLRRALRGSLNRYGIRAVVLDAAPPSWLAPQLARDFKLEPEPVTPVPLRPPSDLRSAPTRVYLRLGAAGVVR